MSLRFTTGTAYNCTRTGPTYNSFTTMFWVYLVADTNNYACMWVRDGSSGIGCLADGLQLGLLGDDTGADTLSVTTWYHITYTRVGDVHKFYLNGNATPVLNVTHAYGDVPAMYLGTWAADSSSVNLNGRIAGLKIWDATELTTGEIATEYANWTPQKTGVWGWYPMNATAVADAVKDESGNARHFTYSIAPTVEAGPPLDPGPGGAVSPGAIVPTITL